MPVNPALQICCLSHIEFLTYGAKQYVKKKHVFNGFVGKMALQRHNLTASLAIPVKKTFLEPDKGFEPSTC
ncbi:MAG: hypothetical protein SFV22_07990 [Saprospiraceae bacterium]|nr:hypothetical protein [Saprospiraceae bacterium]